MDIDNSLETLISGSGDKLNLHIYKNGNSQKISGNCDMKVGLEESILRTGINNFQLLASLNLSHCNLSGLPNVFDESNHLKELNLSHNNITQVPQAIYDTLRLLEHLDLSHNSISLFDGLPKCFLKLRLLRLNDNCLKNIPDFFLKVCCLNLEEFYYSYNEITSLSLSKFRYRGPYKLKKLELKNSLLRSLDLKYLADIRTLQELSLSNEGPKNWNYIDFSCLDRFFERGLWNDQLNILHLCELQISDLPASISLVVNLRELYLSKNSIMWLPVTLTQLKELKVLDVSQNKLFDLPSDIVKLRKLEILKLEGNSLTVLPDLTPLSIKYLDLYDNCLDECCSINWDVILKTDLEYNYFDTNDLCDKHYIMKKCDLRKDLANTRRDIPKVYKCVSDPEDDQIAYYSSDEGGENGNLGEFRSAEFEESWSSCAEDNGCTASDNEWTGTEKPPAKQRSKKLEVVPTPSWMLVDVE